MRQFYVFCLEHVQHYVTNKKWRHEYCLSTEMLFQAVCKTFQLQYPIYQAYESVKNNFEVSSIKYQIKFLFFIYVYIFYDKIFYIDLLFL